MRWWNLKLIKSKDPWVRLKAVERLALKPDAADIGVLASCFSDEAAEVRLAAVKAMGAMPQPESLNALVRALAHSRQDVRAAAIDELTRMSGPAALGLIENSIKDNSHLVRNRAVQALGSLGWQPDTPRRAPKVNVTQERASLCQKGCYPVAFVFLVNCSLRQKPILAVNPPWPGGCATRQIAARFASRPALLAAVLAFLPGSPF